MSFSRSKEKWFRIKTIFSSIILSKIRSIKFYICIILILLPSIYTFLLLSRNIEVILAYSDSDQDLVIFWRGFLSHSLRFLPIFSILFSCDIISEQFEKRTAPLTFTLPVKRSIILLLIVITYEILFLLSAILSVILFQILDLIIFQHTITMKEFFIALSICLLVINIWFSFAFFLSTFTKSTLIALTVPIAYMFIELLVPNLDNLDFLSVSQTIWILQDNIISINTGDLVSIGKIILPIGVFSLVFLSFLFGTIIIFNYQDIKTT